MCYELKCYLGDDGLSEEGWSDAQSEDVRWVARAMLARVDRQSLERKIMSNARFGIWARA